MTDTSELDNKLVIATCNEHKKQAGKDKLMLYVYLLIFNDQTICTISYAIISWLTSGQKKVLPPVPVFQQQSKYK